MKNKIFVLILVVSTTFCCKSKDSIDKSKTITHSKLTSIDTSENSDLGRARMFYSKISVNDIANPQRLTLDSLYYHYDSVQIRLWNIGGLFPRHELYLINYKDSKWRGSYYELLPDSNFVNGIGEREFLSGPLPLKISISKTIRPKSNWEIFIDSTKSLGIQTLPDMHEVPNMEIRWTDSPSLIVEFSTPNSYRFYHYSSVNNFIDSFWQAQRIQKIHNYFFEQFLR